MYSFDFLGVFSIFVARKRWMQLTFVFVFVLFGQNSFGGFGGYDEDAWQEAATFLLQGYFPEADPCKNFSRYACGKWYKNQTKHGQFDSQISIQDKDITKYIEKAVKNVKLDDPSIPKYQKWVKQFYHACNENVSSNLDAGLQLYKEIASVIGTPPLFGKDEKTKVFLQTNPWYFTGFVQRELPFAAPFMKLTVQSAKYGDNATMAVLTINQKFQHIEPLQKSKLESSIQALAAGLKISVDQKEMDTEIDAMVKFERLLAKRLNDSTQAEELSGFGDFELHNRLNVEEVSDNLYTIEELKQKFTNVSWDDFFRGLFTKDQHTRLNETYTTVLLDETEETEKKIFNSFNAFFHRTKPETIFNYVFYKALSTMYQDITFTKQLSKENRATKCTSDLASTFNTAVARMLFDDNKLDPMEWRADIELMRQTIFSAAKYLFAGSSLDDGEKTKVMTKVDQITFYSGIPDWLMDDGEVEKRTIAYNQNLTHVQNMLLIQKGNFERNLDYVIDVFQGEIDAEPVLVTNANYMNFHINMYVGYCFLPWYNPKYPLAVKYGNVGFVMGHELMHAFDTNGITEPAKNLKTGWLNEITMKEMNKKFDCVKKQYAAFCSKEIKQCISGTQTVSENLADIDGIKVAFMAYKFATMTMGKDNPLPGLNDLNSNKIFFLTRGRCACSTFGDIEEWFDSPDVHAPLKARLNFPLKNFDKFAETFQCKAGSLYDSSNRCIVWGEFKGADQ